MEEFKKSATSVFIENIRNKNPDISDYKLEVIKYSFEAGLNVGMVLDKSDFEKEVALQLLSL